MLNIAIVEDQGEIAQQLQSYIEQYCAAHHLTAKCSYYADGSEIAACYTPDSLQANSSRPHSLRAGSTRSEPAHFDIILLDIEMKQMNGMEAARRIRAADRKVVLAFITNMAQYAIEGYSVDAMDFILKPVTYEAFALRFERMITRVQERVDVKIQIQTAQGLQLVSIGDIRYLETMNRLLYYHVGNGKVFSCRNSMKEAEKELTRGHFSKCNQCYLVNLAYVNGIQGDQVNVDGELLDMSRRCKTPFLTAFTDYLGGIH